MYSSPVSKSPVSKKKNHTQHTLLFSSNIQYVYSAITVFQHLCNYAVLRMGMLYVALDPDFYVPTTSKIQQNSLFLVTAN